MNQDTLDYERCERLPHAECTVYQGFEGTYSNPAAMQFFPQYPGAGFSYVKALDATVRAADEGIGDYAVLPIENSTMGSAADSYDAPVEREASVVDKYLSPVQHVLLAYDDIALADIRTTCSHPQGIKQYAPFFEEHPEIEAVMVSDTAVAAQPVQTMEKNSITTIASACAGQIYGFRVLIPTLGYRTENTIRFLIAGKEKSYLCGTKTVSLMMEARHEVDALYHVLGALYAEDTNLLCLAACPVSRVSWAYRFFPDFSRSLEEVVIQRTSREVECLNTSLHILGYFQEELWR